MSRSHVFYHSATHLGILTRLRSCRSQVRASLFSSMHLHTLRPQTGLRDHLLCNLFPYLFFLRLLFKFKLVISIYSPTRGISPETSHHRYLAPAAFEIVTVHLCGY